jgi:outer membrane protein TolC
MRISFRSWLVCTAVFGVATASGAPLLAQKPGGPLRPVEPLPMPREREALAPVASILNTESKPIDLPSALRLAGVQNQEILLARERVVEAVAIRQLAAAQFLPSINLGSNFDLHNGVLQQANGNILRVDRDSLYVGLGANAVGAGTVTIPGIVWAGNVSETIYAALISKQVVRQQEFAGQAVRNEVLLRVAAGYMELLRAEGHWAITLKGRDEAREVARVTSEFAKAGQGRQADADRALTEWEQRNSEVLQAEGDMLTASARLCRLLGLDPSVRLQSVDSHVVPMAIVPPPVPLPELLAMALAQRPELQERRAAIRAALLELRATKVLPFSPNMIVGYSTGTFGGGSDLAAQGIPQPGGGVLVQPRFGSFASRQDFDAVLFWSLRNLGVGNVALVRRAQSEVRTQNLREVEVLDRIGAEVAAANARAHARYAQIETAERAVQSSQKGFNGDFTRTRGLVGLPIEVLDSLRLLNRSRFAYLDAIVGYNLAQFELYVALGQPPADWLARPVPANFVPPTGPTPLSPNPK